MEWQLIVALVVGVPFILLPVAFVWYLDVGGLYKVIRGAFRFADPSMQRCAHRYYLDPEMQQSGYPVGFRCVVLESEVEKTDSKANK